ncbi:hypothetical protein KUV78_16245 [Marinobacter hydrocarbonoclasticus]|uniref:hypothetical protein n=1 Tax=Marinobacter nauticus TaxID=2743 RepID=UPI001C9826BB|nr:hypothetical protein [Marinobacter nauticus]MBY6195350.1 hypothetical protein [Marinobacter nauticus]MBY6216498.1 hypothetical protein [Marinobacter nauticus]
MNCGADSTNDSDQYYGPAAYRPQLIPDQRVQQQDLNHSTLGRSAGFRLPWGTTQDLMPSNLFARWRPEALRRIEEREDLLAEAGDQGQLDHESICYAPLAFRSKVVNAFELYGKAFFWVSLPLGLVTYLMHIYLTDSSFVAALNDVWPFIIALSGIPAAMWLSSTVAFTFFPRWCVKAGRGPEWELNRRTGVVRIWHYRRRIPLFWNYQETVTETPFYEFDGWVAGGATQYGPRFDFILCHRYSKLKIHIGDILLGWHQSPRPCYALWDFLQNYMDVTRPLPEFPVLEPHRHKDPVTAEHDSEAGRPERYWRDMDDKTFQQKEDEMLGRVLRINTEQRPNLMAKKVRYAHMTPEDMLAYGRGSRQSRQRRAKSGLKKEPIRSVPSD